LRNFQITQITADETILHTLNLLFAIHKEATDSKSVSIDLFSQVETDTQTILATQQWKNICNIDSFSSQNKQVGSDTSLLLAKLSLVNTLLLDINHKKNCTLGGMFSYI
jgi:hypothetical protein